MSALIELAERCEAATGTDRELDGLIEVARDPMRETILGNEPGPFPQKSIRGPIKDLGLTGRDLADYLAAPAYTSSIDAAMTLVPEGWHWRVFAEGGAGCASCNPPEVWESPDRFAATPALALCAAALRSHAAGETK